MNCINFQRKSYYHTNKIIEECIMTFIFIYEEDDLFLYKIHFDYAVVNNKFFYLKITLYNFGKYEKMIFKQVQKIMKKK